MDRVLFSIMCTTCEARLNVRDASAVGAIVNCPKCQSMVQVVAPPGWEPPKAEKSAPQQESVAKEAAPQPGKPRKQPAERQSPHSDTAAAAPAKPVESIPPRSQTEEAPANERPLGKKAAAATVASASTSAASASSMEPPPEPSPLGVPEAEPSAASGLAEMNPPPIQAPPEPVGAETAPATQWAAPAEAATQRWLLWGSIPVAGAVMVFGVWILFFSGAPAPKPVPAPVGPVVSVPGDAAMVPAPLSEFDTRWVPDSPQLVLSLDVADNNRVGQLASLMKAVPPLNQAIVAELFAGFGLNPGTVERVTWSSPDASNWSAAGVVVIRLGENQSTSPLRSLGSQTSWQVEGFEFRRLDRPAWPRAYAVLDEHTIVTGDDGLLRQLAERGDKPANLGMLEPLLTAAPMDSDFFVSLDLRAADRAGWPLPAEWFDVWPAGRDAWHVIWQLPSAVSFSFDREDLALAEIGFLCDGETMADKVRLALEQWIPQARSVLSARADGLPASVASGEIPADAAGLYRTSLSGAAAALASSHLESAGRCVWLRADCGSNATAWTSAAADSRTAMQGDWYRAAGAIDKTLHAGLSGAISRYTEVEKSAPPGAISSGPLPPDQVLSWVTAMLPYLGHETWAQDLDRSYSWNSPRNRPVTQRKLEAVQNPAVSERVNSSGYPVTHYVGVAGLGPDAGDLPRSDPRAGVFGYRESRRLSDIPDGASNTIATAGVMGSLGAWASGGEPTVRAFTQKPYINGPDGFGSGQPGGMIVGMADGSARFLSVDTDPTVLEALATAAGGEAAQSSEPAAEEVVSVEPKPAMPPDEVSAPEEMPVPDTPDAPEAGSETEPIADLAERLERRLPGIAMTNTPLQQAVEAIGQFGSLSVTFDLDAMSALDIPLDKPVSIHVTETTLGRVLDEVLGTCGLKPLVRDDQVWVTGVRLLSDRPRTVRYAVNDLTLPSQTSAADLAAWLPQIMAPETWQSNGGQGTVQVRDGVLEIAQTERVHIELLVFFERLRVARGLSPRSGRPAAQFPVASRSTRAAAILAEPVSLNFFRPTPLERILDELDRRCEAQIAVNWVALSTDGKAPSTTATLIANHMPLEEALKQMLRPLGLDYRVIDGRTIEVTSPAAAGAHFEREFYGIRDLTGTNRSGEVIDRLRRDIEPGSWQTTGGQGAVVFDEPSGCLIVLQTQPVQTEIARWLDQARGERTAASQ